MLSASLAAAYAASLRRQEGFDRFQRGLALLPLAALASLAATLANVWIVSGQWPLPNRLVQAEGGGLEYLSATPAQSTIVFFAPTVILLLVTRISFVAWSLALFWVFTRDRVLRRSSVLIGCAGWCATEALLRFGPSDLLNWLWD